MRCRRLHLVNSRRHRGWRHRGWHGKISSKGHPSGWRRFSLTQIFGIDCAEVDTLPRVMCVWLVSWLMIMACTISYYRNEPWWKRLWATPRMHDGCLGWWGLANATNINSADKPEALYHICCQKVNFRPLSLDSLIHLTYWHCGRAALDYIKRAHQGLLQVSEDECILMQKKIAMWFPHTGVSHMIIPSGNQL
jgi:hypothetical protein